MKLLGLIGTSILALALTACPTTRPLDSQNSNNIKQFGPNAVASSTQFLKGSPVEVNSATVYIQQLAQNNPQLKAALANTPKNLSTLFSLKIQPQANALNLSQIIPTFSSFKLKPQAGGTDCGPSSPPADNDNDGIPNSFSYTFNCGGKFYNGQAATLTGTVTIDDKGDNDASSGYDVTFTNLIFAYQDDSIAYGFGTNLNTQVRLGSSGKYTVTQALEFAAVLIQDNKTSTFEYFSNGTLEFTPQVGASDADRFARGTLKFSNKFTFKVNNNGEKYESSLDFASNAMVVDRNTCGSDKMVNSGNVKFTDGKNTLTWNITGCGAGDWNYQ
jgi:hypothetical protein